MRARNDQPGLGFPSSKNNDGPVDCLGQVFESDEVRRSHYLKLLAEKLKEPEFRNAAGFPKGTDDAILRLSDPPYYTACPNPFIHDFCEATGKREAKDYVRLPFAEDVTEGRHDPIYLGHTYHAKVPWRAVLPYVMAYTEPGDLVYDGFAGTGMVGVACAMAAEPPSDMESVQCFVPGERHAVISDLSPIATSISSNYLRSVSPASFSRAATEVLMEVEEKVGHLYRTEYGGQACNVNYFVWSDVFACPSCSHEETYYHFAYSKEAKKYLAEFACPSCQAVLNKKHLERRFETVMDNLVGSPVTQVKRELVLRSFKDAGGNRHHLAPDDSDLGVVREAETSPPPDTIPVEAVPYMHMTHERNNLSALGVTHFHHFFSPRNLIAIGELFSAIWSRPQPERRALLFWVTSCIPKLSRLMNYNADGIGRVTKGIFYFASVSQEFSPFAMLRRSMKDVEKCFGAARKTGAEGAIVSTNRAQESALPDCSVDYVFTDPPFGENVYYADLNYLWEAWLGVRTDGASEAIVSRCKKSVKTIEDYAIEMRQSFADYYRVLKPGRWITVEFHNSNNAIWRAIQESLGLAGFIVADVRVLDKKLKTFKQIVTSSTMKQDLVISAYKPRGVLTQQLQLEESGVEGAWQFVGEHLRNVPVFVGRVNCAEVVAERTPHMLYDRMIAFFVQRGIAVPLSGPEFMAGLYERFPERDGMFFLSGQVTEYDRKRTAVGELRQLTLFVSDEASAIQWVRQQLQDKPQTFQDLQPKFMRQLQSWAKHEKTIELKEILEFNFLCYDGNGPVPDPIRSYLRKNYRTFRNLENDDAGLQAKALDRWYVPDPNKEGDLDKLRLRTLLKEFEAYRTSTARKIKEFRTEAVRAGFKHCYDEGDYQTIANVAAKLPEQVIQEDEKLLMYYDVATMRLGL
jgi:predicted RNA methylase